VFVLSCPLAFQDASSNVEKVKFDAGQIIFRQENPADKLYIIMKGQVEVWLFDTRNGREIRVARLNEGEYFGEIGVLSRTQRTATIQAITPVECLTLDREVLKSVLAASREAYEDMNTVIEARSDDDPLKVLNGDDLSRILGRLSCLLYELLKLLMPVIPKGGSCGTI
jgi:CRP-like cAMP-binding protein